MARIKWIDGLKGLAAFLVCLNHYFRGEITTPERSFWDDPPELNRHWFQLPPFRLLWACVANVSLFMVLSGYSICLSLFHLRDSGRTVDFLLRIRSAVWRRVVRLYLPVVIIGVISQTAFFVGLYDWPGIPEDLGGIMPWQDPGAHIQYLGRTIAGSMHIFDYRFTHVLNTQLWTMPHDLRGSYAVYLAVLGLSAWRRPVRLAVLAATITYFVWYGSWCIFSFMAGVAIAELTVSSDWKRHYSLGSKNPLILLSFTTGVYLLCLNIENNHFPPEYAFLEPVQTSHWTAYSAIANVESCWHTIGASLLVFAIASSAPLQRPFLTTPLQYLGKLHFPIYLVHQLVFRLGRNPLKDYTWWTLTGERYPGTEHAMDRPAACLAAWIGSGAILGGVILAMAEMLNVVLAWCFAAVDHLEKGLHEDAGASRQRILKKD
ncbi:acyltransferase 3 [Aspergillus unguis]